MRAHSSHTLINNCNLRFSNTCSSYRRSAFAIDLSRQHTKNKSYTIKFRQKATNILLWAIKVILWVIKYSLQATNNILRGTNNILRAIEYSLLTKKYSLSAIKYSLLAIEFSLSAIKYILWAVKDLLQAINFLFNANYEILWADTVNLKHININVYAKHFFREQNNKSIRLNTEKGAFF